MLKISLVILLSCIIFSCSSNADIIGNYISKAPDKSEKITLLYLKGDFNFIYTRPGDCHLLLDKDSTFTYYEASCNVDKKTYRGNWSFGKDDVTLHFKDTVRDDMTYHVSGKQLYIIQEVTMVETKQEFSSLTLLEKK